MIFLKGNAQNVACLPLRADFMSDDPPLPTGDVGSLKRPRSADLEADNIGPRPFCSAPQRYLRLDFCALCFWLQGRSGRSMRAVHAVWLLGFCTVLAVCGLRLIFTRPGKP